MSEPSPIDALLTAAFHAWVELGEIMTTRRIDDLEIVHRCYLDLGVALRRIQENPPGGIPGGPGAPPAICA